MTSFMDRFQPYGFNPQSLVAGYGMAENCLAITFREPGEGLKVIALIEAFLSEKGELC